jgi:hypothetical protein
MDPPWTCQRGWRKDSPHLYNTDEEVDRVVEVLSLERVARQ